MPEVLQPSTFRLSHVALLYFSGIQRDVKDMKVKQKKGFRRIKMFADFANQGWGREGERGQIRQTHFRASPSHCIVQAFLHKILKIGCVPKKKRQES